MKDIKNNEQQERQAYVPASVKVITTSAQRVICASTPNSPEQYGPDNW